MRRRRSSFPRAGLVALGLAACVPYPHQATRSPALTGTVHRGGAPVAGARVYLELAPDRGGCQGHAVAQTRTDAEGRFTLPRQRRFTPVVTMDPTEAWQLCVEDGGRAVRGYYVNDVGGPPEHLSLTCDLGAPGTAAPAEGPARGVGICTPAPPARAPQNE